jgi:hypothetical protein
VRWYHSRVHADRAVVAARSSDRCSSRDNMVALFWTRDTRPAF